jgi:serine/threonine protein kinase
MKTHVFIYAQKRKNLTTSVCLECIKELNKLGQGGFGSVYLYKHILNGEMTAAKFVDISEYMNKANDMQMAVKEARFLLNIDHENIINIDTVFLIKKEIVIFTEYLPGGELKDYILGRLVPCTEYETKIIAKCLVSAINYIHSNNIVHRDLKLENILLKDKANPHSLRIIDFGISGLLTQVGAEKIHAGTLMYSPPEIISKKSINSNPKIDVWSLGKFSTVTNRRNFLHSPNQRIPIL